MEYFSFTLFGHFNYWQDLVVGTDHLSSILKYFTTLKNMNFQCYMHLHPEKGKKNKIKQLMERTKKQKK